MEAIGFLVVGSFIFGISIVSALLTRWVLSTTPRYRILFVAFAGLLPLLLAGSLFANAYLVNQFHRARNEAFSTDPLLVSMLPAGYRLVAFDEIPNSASIIDPSMRDLSFYTPTIDHVERIGFWDRKIYGKKGAGDFGDSPTEYYFEFDPVTKHITQYKNELLLLDANPNVKLQQPFDFWNSQIHLTRGFWGNYGPWSVVIVIAAYFALLFRRRIQTNRLAVPEDLP